MSTKAAPRYGLAGVVVLVIARRDLIHETVCALPQPGLTRSVDLHLGEESPAYNLQQATLKLTILANVI